MKFKILLLFFPIMLFQIGCASTNLQPITNGNFQLETDEKGIWHQIEEEQKALNRSGVLYTDKELDEYLNEIARKLYSENVPAQIAFNIHVIKDRQFNAFASPNGHIYINTGILACMENEAQLATLLAHEMTHVTHRHAVKRFRDVKNKTAFLATLNVTLGGAGGGLVSLLGTFGTLASVSGYSRELETEADIEGFKLIKKAGYDPIESVVFFNLLKREIEEEEIKQPFFFGTHPRVQERIENFEDLIKSDDHKASNGLKNTGQFLIKTLKVRMDNAFLDLKAGRFKKARRATDRYKELKPNDAKVYYLLGEIENQERGDNGLERAIDNYKKAISIDSSCPEPYREIGLIYFKQKDKRRAIEFLEQYLYLSKESADKAYVEEYLKQCKEGDKL